mgnify:CR=1 FL=1
MACEIKGGQKQQSKQLTVSSATNTALATVPEANWYPVECGDDASELEGHAQELKLLYPGRYQTRLVTRRDTSPRFVLKVRHRS